MAGVKGRSGGARPNSGGARPNSGPKPLWKKLGFQSVKEAVTAGAIDPPRVKSGPCCGRSVQLRVSQDEFELIVEIRKQVFRMEKSLSDRYFARLLRVPLLPEHLELIDTKRIQTLVRKYLKRKTDENHH